MKNSPWNQKGFPVGGHRNFGLPTEKPRHTRSALTRLIGYFRPYRGRLVIVGISALFSTAFSIVGPKILGQVTTDLFRGFMHRTHHAPGPAVNFPHILHLLLTLLVLYALSGIFGYVQQYLMARVAQNTMYHMRNHVMEKLSRLPIRWFDQHSHGEILSRVVNDFDNIGTTLQQSMLQLITGLITMVGVAVMMLTISPVLTLVVMSTLPLVLVATKAIATRSQKHFIERQRYLGELNGHIEEIYTGHRVVKAFGGESRALERFDALNEALYESGWKAQFITGIIMPAMNFIGNLGYVAVSVIGGILVARGVIQIGDIQAFIQYTRQFSHPMTQLSSISNVIQSTLASAERIFEILDETEETPDSPQSSEIPSFQGQVSFQQVSFGYRPEAPLMTDLTIDVRAGQTVAIVGPTGAGKTTLVNLLMRFYEIQKGSIRIDGMDIARMPRGRLRQHVGMVLQETWLFRGTIRENIAYGNPEASEDDILRATQAAFADHFIRTLAQGYDTVLNEEASNLSEGQRQLITIARALLSNPAILILDEATSSVDTRTEMLVQEGMKNLMRGRTNFVIAHRLSTIRKADLILVMDHGRVVEQGTHPVLLAAGGLYASLYQEQYARDALSDASPSVI